MGVGASRTQKGDPILQHPQPSSVWRIPLLPAGDPSKIAVLTWNIAAVNNKPFEYWITEDNPD